MVACDLSLQSASNAPAVLERFGVPAGPPETPLASEHGEGLAVQARRMRTTGVLDSMANKFIDSCTEPIISLKGCLRFVIDLAAADPEAKFSTCAVLAAPEGFLVQVLWLRHAMSGATEGATVHLERVRRPFYQELVGLVATPRFNITKATFARWGDGIPVLVALEPCEELVGGKRRCPH